jgi:hypothetical protein
MSIEWAIDYKETQVSRWKEDAKIKRQKAD